MQGHLEKSGKYELFETTKGHQILNLNDEDFFAVVEGQKGDILVRSDADHDKKKTLKHGKFYLAAFDDDPEFNDVPHLFLQDGKSRYIEWILPRDLPTNKDHQKKLVRTDSRVDKDKVEYHTQGSGKKGREKQYQGTGKHANSKAEASGKKSGKSSHGTDLLDKNKSELYEMAKKEDLPGRSKMDKQELAQKLSQMH